MPRSHLHTLDGRLIRLFLEVYATASVSRAADRLGLTQSTVSHGLERLRSTLGDPLFVRDGRRITATPHADFLVPRMRAALEALEALADPDTYVPDEDVHPFTLAANSDELRGELTRIYRAVSRGAPSVPIRIIPLGSPSNARGLLDAGIADLVLSVRRGEPADDLEYLEFLTNHQVVFYDGQSREPVHTVDDYRAARHAVVDYGGGGLSIVDTHLRLIDVERKIALAAGSLALLAELMRGSDLVATMQDRHAQMALAGLDMSPPPMAFPPIAYDLLWHRRQTLSDRNIWLRNAVMTARSDATISPPKAASRLTG